MKTMIEVQFNGNNVTDKDLDKYVKETLKAEGIKTTDIDTLNIYYVPESAKLFYVANKKDGEDVNGELAIALLLLNLQLKKHLLKKLLHQKKHQLKLLLQKKQKNLQLKKLLKNSWERVEDFIDLFFMTVIDKKI